MAPSIVACNSRNAARYASRKRCSGSARSKAFFSIGALLSVSALALAGEIGVRQWQLTALLLPGVALGVVTARLIKDHLDPDVIRPAVLVICSIAAIALLIETF